MKKNLPFIIPDICSKANFTILLGILGATQSPPVLEWFSQSYVQLIASLSSAGIRFDDEFGDNHFMNSPFLDKYIIPLSYFNKCGTDIVQFLREAISNDTYVGFICDHFYFPFSKDTYGKEHYIHFSLITGYDDETLTVRIADYFNYKYSIYDCSFDCLREAAMSKYCHSDMPLEDSILCVKRREQPVFPISFNIDRLIFLTREYLKGGENDRIMKGISVYHALAINVQKSNIRLSSIQTLYDHKIAMCHRLEILHSLGYVKVTEQDKKYFDDVLRQAVIFRNTLLRQKMLEGIRYKNALPKTLECIYQFQELDREAMTRFLNMLLESK